VAASSAGSKRCPDISPNYFAEIDKVSLSHHAFGMNRGSCDKINFCEISINRKVYGTDKLAIFKKSSHNPQQSATVGCLGRQHNN
jgi:hypothetical protein